MPTYKAPLQDMQFLLDQVFDFKQHLQDIPAFAEFSPELITTVLEEAAKITETLLFPLNQSGDKQGCQFNAGTVTTPNGFKEAYKIYCEAMWTALIANPEYGGQGLPHVVGLLCDEMQASSNLSFSLYNNLTVGVSRCIERFATDDIKQTYLPKMTSGEWTGVMCLTESHCGSDLGLIRSKATKNADGSYSLTGSKIFITAGEHDLTDNIIHVVLARTPDAPAGVKGLSLFLTPKYLVNADGSLGQRNEFECGSIEHKMGIKASSTCVMNYNGAKAYLVGELNHGLETMFSIMNYERIAIGLEGLALAEVAYQNARGYAQERLQGRSMQGARYPEKAADPIIVHADVRRLLLDIKANNEAARALTVWVGMLLDDEHYAKDEQTVTRAQNFIALFTPIIKAYFTDYGFNACNQALQVFGGHGYVSEWGLEQYVRDARIAQIYEGTNGIQALDLLRRKVVANNGNVLEQFLNEVRDYCQQHPDLAEYKNPLLHYCDLITDCLNYILKNHEQNKDLISASAHDFLHLVSLTALGFMWYRMLVAAKKINDEFSNNKLKTGDYFFAKILPNCEALVLKIKAGARSVMQLADEDF